nr:MAG TPA: hypothetical protein [Caudoviricetes sp.]
MQMPFYNFKVFTKIFHSTKGIKQNNSPPV